MAIIILRVNEVSQVNADLQVLRDCRVHVVFQVLLVLMVLRVQLALLVLTVLKVHPVSRVCQARGVLLEFPVQKATEAIMVRKDLRAHLAKMADEVKQALVVLQVLLELVVP
eukprot:g38274.t1